MRHPPARGHSVQYRVAEMNFELSVRRSPRPVHLLGFFSELLTGGREPQRVGEGPRTAAWQTGLVMLLQWGGADASFERTRCPSLFRSQLQLVFLPTLIGLLFVGLHLQCGQETQ